MTSSVPDEWDPYDHPEGVECVYVQTSIFQDEEIYAVNCSCVEDIPCSTQNCICVKTSGVNYTDGVLIDEKLTDPAGSIFECSESCACSDRCLNRVSQNGPSRHLRIVNIGQKKGFGVFANRTVRKGTFLCEYAGEILSQKGIDALAMPGTTAWPYVITLNETLSNGSTLKTFIDASKFGNIGRYLNHSCTPNAVLIPIRYENVAPKVGIFALRDIEADEECAYLYANADSDRSETPCLCGSDNCNKFLPLGSFNAADLA